MQLSAFPVFAVTIFTSLGSRNGQRRVWSIGSIGEACWRGVFGDIWGTSLVFRELCGIKKVSLSFVSLLAKVCRCPRVSTIALTILLSLFKNLVSFYFVESQMSWARAYYLQARIWDLQNSFGRRHIVEMCIVKRSERTNYYWSSNSLWAQYKL